MTREGSKEAAKIMLAHADGQEIEYRWRGSIHWMKMEGNPGWNWEIYQYRIKSKEKISIPATEEELEIIGKGIYWIKNKKHPNRMGWARDVDVMNKECWYLFNPDTKCWEDWENK